MKIIGGTWFGVLVSMSTLAVLDTNVCVAGVRGPEEHQGVGCGLHVTPTQEGHCQLHPRV